MLIWVNSDRRPPREEFRRAVRPHRQYRSAADRSRSGGDI